MACRMGRISQPMAAQMASMPPFRPSDEYCQASPHEGRTAMQGFLPTVAWVTGPSSSPPDNLQTSQPSQQASPYAAADSRHMRL
jgi:hypothetical protein